jgi:hypothetical protein
MIGMQSVSRAGIETRESQRSELSIMFALHLAELDHRLLICRESAEYETVVNAKTNHAAALL